MLVSVNYPNDVHRICWCKKRRGPRQMMAGGQTACSVETRDVLSGQLADYRASVEPDAATANAICPASGNSSSVSGASTATPSAARTPD